MFSVHEIKWKIYIQPTCETRDACVEPLVRLPDSYLTLLSDNKLRVKQKVRTKDECQESTAVFTQYKQFCVVSGEGETEQQSNVTGQVRAINLLMIVLSSVSCTRIFDKLLEF